MGRNGKKAPVFARIIKLLNSDNVGKVMSSEEMLLGNEPGRNSATAYVYKFVKTGYVEIVNEGERGILDKKTTYRIKKALPPYYNSTTLKNEMRVCKGLIPEDKEFVNLLNKRQA